MKFFTLAAGVQKRFPPDYQAKQLLVINNETVLGRQRQLAELGHETIVVTKNIKIKKAANLSFDPQENKHVLATILSTQELWTERNIFLLGDVFYSKELIKNIIDNQDNLKFWMSGSEIFAFAFNQNQNDKIKEHIKYCLDQKISQKKIWHLYRSLNNIPLNKHVVLEPEIITDYTFDLDSLIQYQDMKKYINILIKEGKEI